MTGHHGHNQLSLLFGWGSHISRQDIQYMNRKLVISRGGPCEECGNSHHNGQAPDFCACCQWTACPRHLQLLCHSAMGSGSWPHSEPSSPFVDAPEVELHIPFTYHGEFQMKRDGCRESGEEESDGPPPQCLSTTMDHHYSFSYSKLGSFKWRLAHSTLKSQFY